MNFQIEMLFCTFVITVILALIIIPILTKLKVGQIERTDGPKSHLKKQGTPTLGGIIILLGITIVTIFTSYHYYKSGDIVTARRIIPLLLVAGGFGLIGFIDDFRKLVMHDTEGLKPAYKMLGLLVISVIYILYLKNVLHVGTETYIPILKIYVRIPRSLYIIFAMFVMLGTTNAVNLTDGVDGLSTSVTTIIITCLVVIASKLGITEVITFGSIVCGANLAFLIFNLNPAKVFMGDTGSLLLGGIIASISLYIKMPLLLLVIALIPVLETLSVILQVVYFKKTGHRMFKMAPLHHHFELSGWRENKVVSVFSIITLLLCIVGILIV